MGFFTRLSDIISANVNSLLDKAEDPQATIRQIIREMEEGVAGAKRSAATAVAAEKRLKHELDEIRRQSDFWRDTGRLLASTGGELWMGGLVCGLIVALPAYFTTRWGINALRHLREAKRLPHGPMDSPR